MSSKISLSTKAFLLLFAFVVAVLATIGVLSIKTPGEMRLVKTDQRRVSDLHGLAQDVLRYHDKSKVPPKTLIELQIGGNTLDPVSGQPYQYRALKGSAFELCATFARSNLESDRGVFRYVRGKPYDWRHPAGHYCFEIDTSKAD